MTKKITVITPAYNAEQYIIDTIKSVACQDVHDLEMIIVNDNSSDKTKALLCQALTRFLFVKVIHNKRNMGPAFCRNLAIRKAKGKYIAFLDADDLWLPEKLNLQLSFMEKNALDFSYSSYYHIDESGRELGSITRGEYNLSYQKLLYYCPIGCLTVIYEKNKFDITYMPNIPRGQDYGLWLKLLKQNPKIGYLDMPLAKYRNVSNSISSAKRKKIINMYQLFTKELSINRFSSSIYVLSHVYHSYMKSIGLTHTSRT